LDQYPSRDRKIDRSMGSIQDSRGPIPGNLRFKDKVNYEQLILNLKEDLRNEKETNKVLKKNFKELNKINEILALENK